MAIGLERFRAITSGDRVTLDAAGTDVQSSELSLGTRFQAWRNGGSFSHGTAAHQMENVRFKGAFYAALLKAEGPVIAKSAVRAAGLQTNWQIDPKPLSAKQVQQILDNAQQIRLGALGRTRDNFVGYMTGTGQPSLQHRFTTMAAANGYPLGELAEKPLMQAINRELKQDPAYAKRTLTPTDIDTIAQRAITKFYGQKQAQFREAHPGLANFVQQHPAGMPREDNRSFVFGLMGKLNPGTAGAHPLGGEPQAFRDLARDTLREVQTNSKLLAKMSYDPAGWQALEQELLAKHQALLTLENDLAALAGPTAPASQEGQDLYQALVDELRHQRTLLQAKAGFLDDVRNADPLSQKTVAHSNLLWAHASGNIMDKAIAHITATSPLGGADPMVAQLQTAKQRAITTADNIYQGTSQRTRTELPTDQNKRTHPMIQGRDQIVANLKHELERAGLPPDLVTELTGKKSLSSARREALAQSPHWTPIDRDIVATKDGVTRTYKSKITPGAHINPRFARRYAQNIAGGPGVQPHRPRAGVSSAEKADHYHARHLKVSELQRNVPGGAPVTMAKVVGNGVLDMWDIEDPGERQAANDRGAHEVLEAAISTNDRVLTEALNRAQNGNPAPVKITHVSINLTTPSPVRELPGVRGKLPDYQELTYTKEQFRAFEANSSAGQGGPVTFHVDDTRPGGALGQDVALQVEVDTINFSFGINPLATGITGQMAVRGGAGLGAAIGAAVGTIVPVAGTIAGALVGSAIGAAVGAISPETVQDALGGWGEVYEHNRGEMVKFLGDLGTGKEGSVGTRPGGFIGSVYDRLDSNDPAQADLMSQMRQQANRVRSMFTHEDFRRGNGDPAKMSREILVMQAMAEQALELVGATDQAATMSKGCKSDKDRGGVVDVELKHDLVMHDMGGDVVPDEQLSGDSLQIYKDMHVGGGALEVQDQGIGVPGSKEAGKLGDRIQDLQAQVYVSGLGMFSAE